MTIWDSLCMLEEIARTIKSPEDFTAFAGVNRLCRSAAKKNFKFRSSLIPWLMLPPKKGKGDSRSFFNLSNGMSKQINLPEANGNRCYSSKGWLLVIDKALNCFLLHPFSNIRIDLPHTGKCGRTISISLYKFCLYRNSIYQRVLC